MCQKIKISCKPEHQLADYPNSLNRDARMPECQNARMPLALSVIYVLPVSVDFNTIWYSNMFSLFWFLH